MKVFKNNKDNITINVSKEVGPITQQSIVEKSLVLLRNGVTSGVVIDSAGNKIAIYTKG